MRDAVIVSSVRTAVGKAPKGSLSYTRPDDLAAIAIKGALDKVPSLDAKEVEDVIMGCAMPEAEQGMNVARIASLRAGLPISSSAMTVNRFCASGLQSIAMAADRIRGGGAEVIIAGGTESMSMVPMGGNKVSANPWLIDHYADSYLSMGLTAERVAETLRSQLSHPDDRSTSARPGVGGIERTETGRLWSGRYPFPQSRARRAASNGAHGELHPLPAS